MNDERWQRIEDLFHRAADLPPAERETFLTTACAGDAQLRAEVESLLANDDPEDKIVEEAVFEAVDRLPSTPPATQDLVGKQVGSYRVLGVIGKGGMGMVYKATDTTLGRSVALKALPAGQFADPQGKRRFLQEAKAASALNHPNIVTVHGLINEQGTDFLIMEYLAGKTLDQVIPRKGLPLKQALAYALEIADALATAHAAGIVHRDIKPANIMVTEQGRVKVLDFGLAKQIPTGKTEGNTSTLHPLGAASQVFGTPAYMSPEQADGKPADARSDVFAFGALLYEMVTGRRAFPGQTVMTILAAVMNQDPPPVHTVQAGVPMELEWIITRCLKKDPERRIQQMVEVKLALREILDTAQLPSTPPGLPRAPKRAWLVPLVIVLLLGLAAGGWLTSRLLHKQPLTFQRLTFRTGDVLAARFAPGGTIVYSASWDGALPVQFSATPGNREARELGLGSGLVVAVSRTGEIAMLAGSNQVGNSGILSEAPIGGGAPRQILENVFSADWDAEGKALAVIRTSEGRHTVEYPIGTVLYQTQALRPPLDLRVSPKGDLVAFIDFGETGDYAVNVIGPKHARQVLSKGWRAFGGMSWAPDGKEIWFSGARTGANPALYALDLSGGERMLAQVPGWGLVQDIATDGAVLLTIADSRIGIRFSIAGRVEERELAWFDASRVYDMSADGKRILFSELSYGDGRNTAIYLRGTDGSAAVRLGYGNRPALSPDGKWVVCTRREAESQGVLVLPTGAGEAKLLPANGMRPEIAEWFPDGKRLLVTGSEAGQPPRTFVRDVSGGPAKPVTQPGVRASKVSPDGKSVVVIKAGKIYLHALDSGSESSIATVVPGDSVIRWSDDERFLFLQRPDPANRGTKIFRVDVSTGQLQLWRELRAPEGADFHAGSAVISADGKSYAFSFQRDFSTLYLMKGLR